MARRKKAAASVYSPRPRQSPPKNGGHLNTGSTAVHSSSASSPGKTCGGPQLVWPATPVALPDKPSIGFRGERQRAASTPPCDGHRPRLGATRGVHASCTLRL